VVPTRQKLNRLRALMAQESLEAYLVPSTDPHQSEYVPACWRRRQWLSGFTGSAGDLVVTRTAAGLWTDGRYFLQAGQELKGSTIKLFKLGVKGVPAIPGWLAANLKKGQAVGVDPRLLSRAVAQQLEAALTQSGAKLKLLDENLVDRIWEDCPPPSPAPIEILPRSFAGETVKSKLRRVRHALALKRADAHVLTALDAIAWLYNIRGQDVDYNPVAIAYALVTQDRAFLFIDPAKLPPRVERALRPEVQVRPYDDLGPALARLAKQGRRVWVDGQTVNAWILKKLKGSPLVTDASPVTLMKARKNAAEIAGMKAAHERDGVAMVRFLAWLEGAVTVGGQSEVSVAEKLLSFRAQGKLFRGESFATIAGYGAHGAIIHYGATSQTDVPLEPHGILLLDSGGQYLDGTTDITRTILLGGEATEEQRNRFTRVLQGHIALFRCRFPAGTAGRQIDALARLALWDSGLDYAHGTGHGVGAYLNVHEGPQAISHTRCTGVPLEEGNVLSNEPGFYKEGEYGIRIENLMLVVRDEELSRPGQTFLGFEPLTLCPIDTRLVEPSLLTQEERGWLNLYHGRVHETMAGMLPPEAAAWLARATRPVG
jgi:Xaa-Pro aminopeptidase